MLAGKNNK